jgi:uncharacterized membrane protein
MERMIDETGTGDLQTDGPRTAVTEQDGKDGSALRERFPVNVHPVERVGSALLGAALLAYGARRRTVGGIALGVLGADLLLRGAVGHCFLYRALEIDTAHGPWRELGAPEDALEVQRTVTVSGTPEDLFTLWREPATQRQIWAHFADLGEADLQNASWTLRAPLGIALRWQAQIVEEQPGELLRWASLPGAGLPNDGNVRFRRSPGGVGSEVVLRARFDPPLGRLGDAAAKLFGRVPEKAVTEALQRFKRLAETGEAEENSGTSAGEERRRQPSRENEPASRAGEIPAPA